MSPPSSQRSRSARCHDKEGSARIFGNRPYCNARTREFVNREARAVLEDDTESVDPDDVGLDDVVAHAQQRDQGVDDASALVWLLRQGLSVEEAGVVYLHEFVGLEPREIYYAQEGIRTAPNAAEKAAGVVDVLETALGKLEDATTDAAADVDVEAVASMASE